MDKRLRDLKLPSHNLFKTNFVWTGDFELHAGNHFFLFRKSDSMRQAREAFEKKEEYKNLPHANLKTPVVNLTSTWAQVLYLI